MKKITLLLTGLMLVFIISNSTAQQCAFDGQREKLQEDPNFVQIEQEAEERIQNSILSGRTSNRRGTVYTIPVVVHVLHLGEAVGSGTNISDAQIQSSIDNLNYFYRGQSPNSPIDFEVEFALAQQDPNCNTSTGINRINASSVTDYSSDGVAFFGSGADETTLKDLSRWPEDEYFNIWIVTEIDGNNGGFGFQGYANFYNGFSYEGSVMMYTVFGHDPTNANPAWPLTVARDNSTVLHEVGHYFHLYHTFQGDDTNNDGVSDSCPANITVGTDSDGCSDTVPHQRETSTCPANNTCTGNPWIDTNTINNIMGYYNCSDKLTNDQLTRVRAVLDNAAIVNSKGDEAIDPTYAAPTAVCVLNTGVDISGAAGIISVELNGKTVNSNTSGGDGGNLDQTNDCNEYFEIDTLVSNTLNVEVWNNLNQLGVWIDWNDDGDFDDNAEQQYLVTQEIDAYSIVPVTLTYPSTIPYNDYVRVRIINELDSRYPETVAIDSACFQNLYYGQSEDYVIYVQPGTLSIDNNTLADLSIYATTTPKELVIKGELKAATTADLYDIQGRLVLNKVLDQYSNANVIDVSTISTGIYIVKIFDGTHVKTQKLIIK